jgi:hypothetical protein
MSPIPQIITAYKFEFAKEPLNYMNFDISGNRYIKSLTPTYFALDQYNNIINLTLDNDNNFIKNNYVTVAANVMYTKMTSTFSPDSIPLNTIVYDKSWNAMYHNSISPSDFSISEGRNSQNRAIYDKNTAEFNITYGLWVPDSSEWWTYIGIPIYKPTVILTVTCPSLTLITTDTYNINLNDVLTLQSNIEYGTNSQLYINNVIQSSILSTDTPTTRTTYYLKTYDEIGKYYTSNTITIIPVSLPTASLKISPTKLNVMKTSQNISIVPTFTFGTSSGNVTITDISNNPIRDPNNNIIREIISGSNLIVLVPPNISTQIYTLTVTNTITPPSSVTASSTLTLTPPTNIIIYIIISGVIVIIIIAVVVFFIMKKGKKSKNNESSTIKSSSISPSPGEE